MKMILVAFFISLSAQAALDKGAGDLYEVAYNSAAPMQERWSALTLAIQSDKNLSEKSIQTALRHKDWFVRNAALVALKESRPELAEKASFQLMSDKAMVVRVAAVNSLSNDLSPAKRDLLWAELSQKYNFRKKQSLWVRGQIIEKLAQKPLRNEIPHFARALNDNDERVVNSALLGLENISRPQYSQRQPSVNDKKTYWNSWVKKNPNY